eukprot:scaffold13460_cov116-Isochrysis_galbana.AAC.4
MARPVGRSAARLAAGTCLRSRSSTIRLTLDSISILMSTISREGPMAEAYGSATIHGFSATSRGSSQRRAAGQRARFAVAEQAAQGEGERHRHAHVRDGHQRLVGAARREDVFLHHHSIVERARDQSRHRALAAHHVVLGRRVFIGDAVPPHVDAQPVLPTAPDHCAAPAARVGAAAVAQDIGLKPPQNLIPQRLWQRREARLGRQSPHRTRGVKPAPILHRLPPALALVLAVEKGGRLAHR